ncbi:flavin reductase family protein [Lactococcus insecticola]|uniref:Nitrilotriacetate monooxygenase n=1 Tax=Pseudolactococcus insecticola TaxID=2709158 RepID=A0A6A0B8G6_9LACT|nr:flavin reductase family protein [Lactococcus insecticola]GFH40721.1 nitrilotriacetate monooxygenase [Lactococcus insecticola]
MKSFTTAELNRVNPYLAYKLLSGSVIPRPIAWVTTQSADGTVNAAPFSFFNVVSSNPPLVSISMMGQKDSVANILDNGEAVIHFVNPDNVEQMNMTAASLPSQMSETQTFDIATEPSKTVKVPSITNAPIKFEAKLFKHVPVESNGYIVSNLMILEVTNFAFADNVFDETKFYVKPEELKPIARLAGNTYAELGDLFDIQRPQ